MNTVFSALRPSAPAVTGTTLGASLATLVVWGIQEFAKVQVPPEVAIALGTIFGAFLGHFIGYNKGEEDALSTEIRS